MTLGDLSTAEEALLRGSLAGINNAGIHVSIPTIKIPVPASLVRKVRQKVGPIWGQPPVQALLGAVFAAIVTEIVGWKTTSVGANYTGVDAILRAGDHGPFVVLEAKGGPSAKLDPGQMYDKWIEKKVQKAIQENKGPDADALFNNRKGPLLAAVIKTDLTSSQPYIYVKVQTFPHITPWRDPFE
jgi:hypothetical protein